MTFTWRKRWSKKFDDHVQLKFATSTGVVSYNEGCGKTFFVDGPGHLAHVCEADRGRLLCCWNGGAVFVHSLRNMHTLNYCTDQISLTTRFSVDLDWGEGNANCSYEEVDRALELSDGTLLVVMNRSYVILHCDTHGRARVTNVGKRFDDYSMVSWMNGVLCADNRGTDPNIFLYDPSRDKKTVLLRYGVDTHDDDEYFIFSGEKYAFAIRFDGFQLHEWDARGRERVFSLGGALGESPVLGKNPVVRQGGTCRGRAFLSADTYCDEREDDIDNFEAGEENNFEAFLYMGDGRFVAGPEGHGQWAAYGNRAYLVSDDTTLKCYEARETSDMLVNLCARRAAALGLSDEQLKTITVELRELVSSWT